MATIILDIECYKNFFYVGMKRRCDGARYGVEFSDRKPEFKKATVRNTLLKNETVGFNSLSYDLPMLWLALTEDLTTEELKRASDRIIKGGLKWWDVEEALGITIPKQLKDRHIDLIEPQPNAFASLKALNGRMHGKQMQDLPYHESTILTHDQMDVVADYCLNVDLDATHLLLDTLDEPLELRRALSEAHGQNFMSKSDAQIGEAIVKKTVEKITGKKARKVETPPGTTFKYPVQPWMKFENPDLKKFLDDVREMEFVIGPDGKTISPPTLKDRKIEIGDMIYSVGIGGLHSTEKGRAVHSTTQNVLVDADVASQYPKIIMMMGLFPKSLGPAFLEAYESILNERLRAKARAKEIYNILPTVNDPDRIAALKHELIQCQVADKGQKIALNGVYGKLGSRYSIVYGPHLLIAVTLTGQISLLMLIEQANKRGIGVVSGNTDGVLFSCPREKFGGIKGDFLLESELKDLCDEWEKMTDFTLEFSEYKSIYNSSVNTYYAIKANGEHKRKGPIGNPWNKDKSDFDQIRGQLMKNPTMTICTDAALAKIKHGTPVEETIRGCTDFKQFVEIVASKNGCTWRGEYLGRVARFYWSVDGEPVFNFQANANGNYNKVPRTDGARECMLLPDHFPDDVDYERYIKEAESILVDVGYYGDWVEPIKLPRVTLRNANTYLKYLLLGS